MSEGDAEAMAGAFWEQSLLESSWSALGQTGASRMKNKGLKKVKNGKKGQKWVRTEKSAKISEA